jgi:hypothetical protein
LDGGIFRRKFEIFIGNLPTEEVFHQPLQTNFIADTHFYWFYNFAQTPPPATDRLVPMFPLGPEIGTGPRCMMALYLH